MKPFLSTSASIFAGLSSAFALLPVAVSAADLFSDDFSDGNRDGWYSLAASSSAAGNVVGDVASFSSGKGLRFYSNYANNAVVTSFSGVTLASAGDYVELSAVFRYSAPDIAGNATTGPLLGLYNNASSPIVADGFGADSEYGQVLQNWEGYKATKYIEGTSSDGRIFAQDPIGDTESAFYNWQGSAIDTDSSGFALLSGVNYATSLRIELGANLTDVTITYSITDGGTNSFSQNVTVAASTLTFNEIALSAYSGQAAVNGYVGDVLVTSNIPEPSHSAMLFALGAVGGGLLRRRRMRD